MGFFRSTSGICSTRFGIAAFTALVLCSATAAAQSDAPQTREQELAQAQADKAKKLKPYVPGRAESFILGIEQAGGFGVINGFTPVFGGIQEGSGLAGGVALGKTSTEGAIVEAIGEYSIRNFSLVQLFYQAKPLWHEHVIFNGRARLQDAPRLAFYGLGTNAPKVRANYGARKTEVSAQAIAKFDFLRLAGGSGAEWYMTNIGDPGRSPVNLVYAGQAIPGLGNDPTYVHSWGLAALDSRDSPGYSRSGGVLQGLLHDYRERTSGRNSFRRVEGLAEGLLPIHNGNMVFDLAGRVWTTTPDSGNTVPFFLMPTLGGGDYLRGYPTYRFRDRHALYLTAEYRWYVQEFIDGAFFYEAGKVAPRTGDLNLKHLKSDYGVGIRFHSPSATALRLEVARGREGVRINLGFSSPAF